MGKAATLDKLIELAIHLDIALDYAPAELDYFRPFLDRMADEGAVFVMKFDGRRPGNLPQRYAVLVSGGPLANDYLRRDSHSLEEALSHVVFEYAARVWGFGKLHLCEE